VVIGLGYQIVGKIHFNLLLALDDQTLAN